MANRSNRAMATSNPHCKLILDTWRYNFKQKTESSVEPTNRHIIGVANNYFITKIDPKNSNFDQKLNQFIAIGKTVDNYRTAILKISTTFTFSYKKGGVFSKCQLPSTSFLSLYIFFLVSWCLMQRNFLSYLGLS